MYIVINNKKIKIKKCTNFFSKLKGLMLIIEPLEEGLLLEKCNSIHTFFMCQNIDVIMTDKDNKIVKLYKNLESEKIIWPKRKVSNVYEIPENSIDNLKIGETLKVLNNND